MKVQLEKVFPMAASPETTWALLQDIEAVAGCLPGARITERIDDRHYKGTVAVKLGPANMSFRGEVEVKSVEPSTRKLHLFAKGTDSTGGSAASMDLTARVETADAASCKLIGTSEVSVSGKAATFGSRVMGPVADQVMNQFAGNFATKLQSMQPAAGAASAVAQPPPASEAKPLNALALAWAVIKDWLRSLFGANRA
jgi:carbon monoxide dehydrogenase subunit G